MPKELDLVCFSYLASARVLQIEKYPELNRGAEVTGVIDTLAADAPMTAITASRLGLKTGLIANSLGNDEVGKRIINNLSEYKVTNQIDIQEGIKTPFIVVLSDESGNREWLSYTSEAGINLLEQDLSLIKRSSLVYIDYYTGIQKASLRAIDFASENNIPIFLNLSGEMPSDELIERIKGKNIAITQVGLHESMADVAEEMAKNVFEKIKPSVSIVTMASMGAIAVNTEKVVKNKAYSVKVRHVHGAGAVFSGGFVYGYLKGWDLDKNLDFACAIGSLSCSKERGYEQFTLKEVQSLISNKNK